MKLCVRKDSVSFWTDMQLSGVVNVDRFWNKVLAFALGQLLKSIEVYHSSQHILKLIEVGRGRTISWQEDIPGHLSCDAETKDSALHGVEK